MGADSTQVSGGLIGQGTSSIATPRYRAFLSYSHRDAAWAKWLHRSLEGYRIDKDLVGRETPCGPVPRTLRPIFRDREDFAAGHSLAEHTIAALEASQFLIVICSPNSARSHYVNEEIRHFKALGRGERVIPIIVDGEPGDPTRECFSPALRFKLAPNAALSNEPEEPVAADARRNGDAKEIAKRKVVAGLLGLGLDEIMRRAERARKRRSFIRLGGTGVAIVVVAGTALGWWGVNLLYDQLRSAEDLNFARDAANICDGSSDLAVAEVWRIALASECVATFSEMLADLPPRTRLPQRVISLFEASLALLQKFRNEQKLTPDQTELLNKAELIAARLSQR